MRELLGPFPPGRDPEDYDRLRRRVLWLLPTGLYVMGSRAGSRRNLMTISWVMQVALEPKLVAASVERAAVTHELVSASSAFALSILSRDDRDVVRRFAKPVEEQSVDERTGAGTMQSTAVTATRGGAPVLEAALAWMDCEVRHRLDLHSHTLFVGEVVDCGSKVLEEAAPGTGAHGGALQVLRMEDTRMNYGG